MKQLNVLTKMLLFPPVGATSYQRVLNYVHSPVHSGNWCKAGC